MRQSSKTLRPRLATSSASFAAKVSRPIEPRSLPLRVRTANEFDPDFAVARDQQVRDPLQACVRGF